MEYPTLDEVNAADQEQLCRWYRFLPSPGAHLRHKMPEKEFNQALDDQLVIINRICDRVKEGGGFTPELSKKIGW